MCRCVDQIDALNQIEVLKVASFGLRAFVNTSHFFRKKMISDSSKCPASRNLSNDSKFLL